MIYRCAKRIDNNHFAFFGKKLENAYNLCIFAKRNSTE